MGQPYSRDPPLAGAPEGQKEGKMKYKNFGSPAIVIAAILWGLDGLLRRQLFTLPASVVVFWEHVFGLVILAPFIVFTFKYFKKLTAKQWQAIVIVSLLSGALGTIFYTAALSKVQFIPFSVIILLQQLEPIFAIAAAAWLLKERLSKRFILLAVVALIAGYITAFPTLKVNLATGSGTALAALLAVGAAASWGVSTALSKYSLKNTSSVHITAARFAFTPIFALGLVFLLGQNGSLMSLSSTQWLYIVAITFSTGLVALAIYYFGLKRVLASRATLLELAFPLSAVVIGQVFLGDKLSLSQWLGAAALTLIIYLIAKEANEEPSDTIKKLA